MKRIIVKFLMFVLAMILFGCLNSDNNSDNNDFISENIGKLKYVPAGKYQRDLISSNISVITESFFISEKEITKSQWIEVSGGWTDPSDSVFSSGSPEDPVQMVTWYHAIAFCNKLSLAEGFDPVYSVTVTGSPIDFMSLSYTSIPTTNNEDWNDVIADWSSDGYRLPTEMEWMWASMGAWSDCIPSDIVGNINTGGYIKGYSGSCEIAGNNENLVDYAWYTVNSINKSYPVGSKRCNELGLFDMNGNVWEWNWDLYDPAYPSGILYSDMETGKGANSGDRRVLRGGGWPSTPSQCAIAYRYYNYPDTQFNHYGFRVVKH